MRKFRLGWFLELDAASVAALAAAAGIAVGDGGADNTEALRDALAEHDSTRRFVTARRRQTLFVSAAGPSFARRSSVGFSNAELKAECKELGLRVSGGRFDLVLRLVKDGHGADGADELVALE
jgi:hypothetical protein